MFRERTAIAITTITANGNRCDVLEAMLAVDAGEDRVELRDVYARQMLRA